MEQLLTLLEVIRSDKDKANQVYAYYQTSSVLQLGLNRSD